MEKKKVVPMKDAKESTDVNMPKQTSEELEWEDQVTLGLSCVQSILNAIHLISENNDLPEPFDSALDHLSSDGLERIKTIFSQVESRAQIIALKRLRVAEK